MSEEPDQERGEHAFLEESIHGGTIVLVFDFEITIVDGDTEIDLLDLTEFHECILEANAQGLSPVAL